MRGRCKNNLKDMSFLEPTFGETNKAKIFFTDRHDHYFKLNVVQ